MKTTITINSTAIEQHPGVQGGALTVDGLYLSLVLKQLAAGNSISQIARWMGADLKKLKAALRAIGRGIDKAKEPT